MGIIIRGAEMGQKNDKPFTTLTTKETLKPLILLGLVGLLVYLRIITNCRRREGAKSPRALILLDILRVTHKNVAEMGQNHKIFIFFIWVSSFCLRPSVT